MIKCVVKTFFLALLTMAVSSCKEDSESGEVGPVVPYASDEKQEEIKAKFPLEDRKKWKVVKVNSFMKGEEGKMVFDGNPKTMWHTKWGKGKNNNPRPPHEIQIDMGEELELHGFTYLPRQEGGINGTIKQYEFYVSNDVNNWGQPVSKGQFDKIHRNMGIHYKEFEAVKGRYIRLVAKREIKNQAWASCAELNVIVEE